VFARGAASARIGVLPDGLEKLFAPTQTGSVACYAIMLAEMTANLLRVPARLVRFPA